MTDRDLDVDALERALGGQSTDAAPTDDAGEKEGTFLVTHAEADSAVLRDVDSGQVHALSSNPGLEAGEAVEGTLASDPPMNVSWQVVDVNERRELSLSESDESVTENALEVAAEQDVGELTRVERAGTGELHVVSVPEEGTEDAVADVLDDREATLARAARLGVRRVEVRSAPGVVVVRYLP